MRNILPGKGKRQDEQQEPDRRVASRPTAHPKSAPKPAPVDPAPQVAEVAGESEGKTVKITKDLRRDIADFLGADYSAGSSITVAEIMQFYSCPEDRARRVIAALVQSGTLELTGKNTYCIRH